MTLAIGHSVRYKRTMLLPKAKSSVAAARLCLEHGHPDSAVSRAYYGMFQAAQVALAHVGLRRAEWTHGGLQAAFVNELTRRRKLLPVHLSRYLHEALALRQIADYREIEASRRRAGLALSWAEEFLGRVEEVLQHA